MNFQKKFSDYLKRLEWRGKMVDKKAVKETINLVKDFSMGTLSGVAQGYFFVPSAFRKSAELDSKKTSSNYERWEGGGRLVSWAPVIVTLGILPLLVYCKLIVERPEIGWPLLGGQILTNVSSGLYEIYRSQKNKLSKESALEKAVKESSEIKPPIAPQTYKNPFEIDLPKNDKIDSLVYSGQNLGGRN